MILNPIKRIVLFDSSSIKKLNQNVLEILTL